MASGAAEVEVFADNSENSASPAKVAAAAAAAAGLAVSPSAGGAAQASALPPPPPHALRADCAAHAPQGDDDLAFARLVAEQERVRRCRCAAAPQGPTGCLLSGGRLASR
jgi:hypothetical protein